MGCEGRRGRELSYLLGMALRQLCTHLMLVHSHRSQYRQHGSAVCVRRAGNVGPIFFGLITYICSYASCSALRPW